MPEHKKRIIVEGVDFHQVFFFPRLFRAASMAMQPGRMVLGLLMVTALITFGRIWDSMTVSKVSPSGLHAGVWRADVDGPAHQTALRAGMVAFTGASVSSVGLGGSGTDLEAAAVLEKMNEEYGKRRIALTEEAERRELDETYAEAVAQIRNTGPRAIFGATAQYVFDHFKMIAAGVISLDTGAFTRGLAGVFIETPRALWKDHAWFAIGFGLVVFVVCAIGGGAISRMVAVQLSAQQRVGVREALEFSMQRWWAMFAAQSLPIVLVAIAACIIMIMGVLMAAPVLDVIGAVLYGVALLIGLVIAFLLVGYLFGHSMLVPAVACENCTGPDAMQRAYAYVMTRPLHLLGYLIVALIGIALSFFVVRAVAGITLNTTAMLYSSLVTSPALVATADGDLWSMARHVPQFPPDSWHDRWTAGVIAFWETLVVCLVAAYVLSYYFTASTIGYLLMRRAADGQEIDEIWQPGLVPGTFVPTAESSATTTPQP